jgi:DNA polymerase-3 subunit alpha
MKWVEPAGLVKFDFLGLKTLTIIDRALKYLKKRGISVDLEKIPLDDPPSYELFASGMTYGVFQLEGQGMRDTLRKVRPTCLDDIIALISLYRPGPMDNIPTYIRRKHGEEKINYPHPLLEPTLKETYGVIVYQEQVMEIAKVLAGYSLGAADLLRRAMGKKIKEEMDQQRAIFTEGAMKNGVPERQAGEIFDLVDKFAGYGFNKSHAAAYALISYQTAFLKAHYLPEFLTASINLEIDNTDKINIFLQVAKSHKIPVLPPSLNESEAYFSVERVNSNCV